MDTSKLIKILRDHARALEKLPDPSARFRAMNYGNVANSIESNYEHEKTITPDHIEPLVISDYMKGRLRSIIDGKPLETISMEKKTNDKISFKKELTEIMGIGSALASQLIKDGLKRITELSQKKWMERLPTETRLFLKYTPERQIPHGTIKILEKKILDLASKSGLPLTLMFVGSYRRKKDFSRDIDIMVISDDENIIEEFLKMMKGAFKVYPYSQGKDKLSAILGFNNAFYKFDAFRVSHDDMVPMLLYSTGSKDFNVRMRHIAKTKGYLLNQRGLFKGAEKVRLNSEKDYFDFLGMEYREPRDR